MCVLLAIELIAAEPGGVSEGWPKWIAAAAQIQAAAAILVTAALQSGLRAGLWSSHGDWFAAASTHAVAGVMEAVTLTVVHGFPAKSSGGIDAAYRNSWIGAGILTGAGHRNTPFCVMGLCTLSYAARAAGGDRNPDKKRRHVPTKWRETFHYTGGEWGNVP